MTVNQATIDLIKSFEKCVLEAYQDSVGVWTIGWGTTAWAGVGIAPRAGTVITKAQADDFFDKTIEKFAATIAKGITKPINENEFGAFVSLAYNIGTSAFLGSSALRLFNAGDKAGAADAILLWNKAKGKILNGLVRRRKAERALFLTPPDTQPRITDEYTQPQIKQPPSGGFSLWGFLTAMFAFLFRK